MGATPFIERILRAKLPKGFDKPTDMKYDGTKDPQEHLTTFEARMNLEGAADAVRCRAFPVTLAGPAIKWFNALPNGSIAFFHDVTRKFMAQFTTRITKAKHPISLLGITQKQDESTRKYLDRFNDECLTVDGLTDSVASLCLTNGLMNEDCRKHLTTKPVWTMHEIQNVARDYINDEEVSQVVAANKRQHGNLASRQNPPPRENQRDHPRLTNTSRPPRIGKFSNYTPLTAPITEIYHQIADREDCHHGTSAEDAPFVISARIRTGLVRRILVDTGADSNILFRGAFDKLGLHNDNLQTHRNGVTGLGDNFLKPDDSITLPITIGTSSQKKKILYEFIVLKDSTAYNVILGRKTINDLSAFIFTKYLLMKFRTDDGSVGTIHGDREVAAECDNTSLALRKKSRDAAGVFLADLDARQDGQPRPKHADIHEKNPTKRRSEGTNKIHTE
ncbi:uncharacterized protein [Arachis hypogaea]|uniref:uncharacterized protein n=1 Tax=Arachis hypogaea TaxID=3818 RepID=UPI003B2232DC